MPALGINRPFLVFRKSLQIGTRGTRYPVTLLATIAELAVGRRYVG